MGVAREGNQLTATIGTDYSDLARTAQYDQVVVNYGTRPLKQSTLNLKHSFAASPFGRTRNVIQV